MRKWHITDCEDPRAKSKTFQTLRYVMKMLIVGLAVATLLGEPAFAQSYDPDIGTGNITPSNEHRPAES
jgi:hypothetical protein